MVPATRNPHRKVHAGPPRAPAQNRGQRGIRRVRSGLTQRDLACPQIVNSGLYSQLAGLDGIANDH